MRPGQIAEHRLAGVGAAVLGGVLWVLAAPPIGLWPLAWIAAAPTLWAIDRAPTARRAGLLGGLTAAVFTIGGFPWIVGLLTRFGQLPGAVATIGLLVLAAIHGVVFLLGARLVRSLRDPSTPGSLREPSAQGERVIRKRGPLPLALCGALGAFAVEVVGWTPFPFSLGAIALNDVGPVRALSAALGPAGITALVVAAAGALVDAATERGRRRWLPAAGVAGFAVLLAVGSIRTGGGATRTIQVGLHHADLVVWSEASYPFPLPRTLDGDHDATRAARIRRGFTIPVVIGAITTAGRDHYNSAIMVLPDDRFAGRHDKVHRMIGSEYNPILEWFPSAAKIMPAGAGAYAGGDRAVLLEAVVDGAPVRIAALVCLEDVMPGFGRELAALDPDLVVNVTNDSWFGNHEPLQHEALARYRPVEIGAPLVRAVNTGPSSIIDADGRFVARTEVVEGGAPATLLADVTIGGRRHSFYAAWGGPLGWLIAGGSIAWWLLPGLIARFRRRTRALKAT